MVKTLRVLGKERAHVQVFYLFVMRSEALPG